MRDHVRKDATASSSHQPSAPRSRGGLLSDATTWYALYGLVLVALWSSGAQAWWASQDAAHFHVPQIRLILAQGVWPSLVRPLVAMPIGFHWTAGLIHSLVGVDVETAGRVLSLLCMVLALTFTYFISRRLGPQAAFINLFLLMGSWPLLSATLSSVTDTMGFALFALFFLCLSRGANVAAALSLGALILVRQYYAAVVLALLVMALWAMVRQDRRWAARAALTALPGLASLMLLVFAWGGLVPPAFRDYHHPMLNWGAAALILAWSGAIGLLALLIGVRWTQGGRWWLFCIAGLAGLALMFFLPTTNDPEQGRWGDIIWQTARLTEIGGHSYPVIILGAMGVCFGLTVLIAVLQSSEPIALLLIVSAVGLSAELMMQPFAWQRYVDPMLGFCLINAYFFATSGRKTPVRPPAPPRQLLQIFGALKLR